ncbi:MAG TPA: hypothetical protein VF784_04130 [Anaerolineales bacterium]
MKLLLRFGALFFSLTLVLLATGTFAVRSAAAESPDVRAATVTPHVIQVGTWNGVPGAYSSIQPAVDAASPGDWILIGPGTYHETGSPSDGVRITTPGLHLRGMDRNSVVIDGTRAGFGTCSSDPAAQLLGPSGAGRNGIEVFKVDGVTIENLTACNFLDGVGGGGNEIWWNGGDGSGVIGMGSYRGAYLTASTTFYSPLNSASYGIFASNASGPGLIERSYASNMSDSGFYVGACPDCNAVLDRVHAQNSPQGFSGTNAGGHLVLQFSEWDHNRVGIASTTLANDDRPSPQNGACPGQPGQSCTKIQHNYVHDNNNPNTPGEGIAATVPTGTGILLSGGRNDTVQGNLVTGNGAWGIMVNDYPDASLPYCDGGVPFFQPPPPYDQILGPVIPCYFHSFGNRVYRNRLAGNGTFGNNTNGDLANAVLDYPVRNCFFGNTDSKGKLTSSPANLQDPAVAGSCTGTWTMDPSQGAPLFLELLCDAFGPASGACSPSDHYPTQTTVTLMPIPHERGMDDPCAGVPENSWCQNQ